MSPAERMITFAGQLLRVVSVPAYSARPMPVPQEIDTTSDTASNTVSLSPQDARRSIGLMRINHVGEVCAQALYLSQAHTAQRTQVREFFKFAAEEETAHLAWTEQRLHELGGRTSRLTAIWFTGAYVLGSIAGKLPQDGDGLSLGFAAETERQVEAHLASHLSPDGLPKNDDNSRAVVLAMQQDEVAHANTADALGATPLPLLARVAMQGMAGVMKKLSYYI